MKLISTYQLLLHRFQRKAFWKACKFFLYVYKRSVHSVDFFIIHNVYLLKISSNWFCLVFSLEGFFGWLYEIHSWTSALLICSWPLCFMQFNSVILHHNPFGKCYYPHFTDFKRMMQRVCQGLRVCFANTHTHKRFVLVHTFNPSSQKETAGESL